MENMNASTLLLNPKPAAHEPKSIQDTPLVKEFDDPGEHMNNEKGQW